MLSDASPSFIIMIDDINAEYVDDSLEINSSTFNQDFDEVGFDPIEVDDSDAEMEKMFGY